ncbi:MAG TPA: long-chain-acyl-CoA synthetase [Caulobacteraceae bacterium]|jgi:fatty-acyl-CoA synthase|nr:long-chain-acyl-CoA synthetase [Caulobacteraceae bacterium]
MLFRDRMKREMRFLTGLFRTLGRVRSIAATSPNLICDDLEAAVDRWRERPALSFEGETATYGEMDAIANRYAHWAQEQGIVRGETVALFMPNRLEYLPIWYGLSKVGVATALINNQLTGAALAHCLNISGARNCLVDADTWPAFEAAREQLTHDMAEWTLDHVHTGQRALTQTMKGVSPLRPDRKVREGMTARDTALYIYTSGTTGLPKAARITHMRAQLYMRGFAGATGARPDDKIYITLPLYHATGGLCGMGAALLNGGSVALKRKFSASQFWEDVVTEGCTQFVYIGELCRYLANQPHHYQERAHKLRLAFGNGLRPDVWTQMQERFGVPRILEFYGSTEGNVSMFNFDGTLGAIGRLPKYLRGAFNVRLARFDLEKGEPTRGPDGFCIEAAVDEAGECLGQIHEDARGAYTGYADKAASEKKVAHDVFSKGDRWFRTGDLLRQDAEGYFYFVDRVGDTFRWKGENVSTSEVSERLLAAPGVEEANVYGVAVEGQDGRAGMAGIVVGEGFDMKALGALMDEQLPAYAQPLFLRLLPAIETTGTFKYRKLDLIADGFDPAKVKDVYFRDPGKRGYVKLTKPLYAKILAGEVRV